jgi:LPS-assembly protein
MTITFFKTKILAQKKTILFTICIGAILYSFPIFPNEKPTEAGQVIIEGDTLENILDRKLKATGNAILIRDNKSIKANLIEYDQISDELYATGNVELKTDKSVIKGTELELSLDSSTGSLANSTFNSTLKDRNSKFNNILRGKASLLFLEGENKKRLENASLTTCEVNQDDWFINASELEINERSQRVNAKNAKLEFKGYPILFSPLVNFSFNDERKSGFLVPSFGSTSRSGFETAIPYYFNLSPTSDATLTPRYMGKRGAQLSGEYRYLNSMYRGETSLEIMPSDNASDTNNRYYAKLNHFHNFNNGFEGGYNIEKVSDDNYFSDMSSLITVTSQVNLKQEVFLNYTKNDWSARLLTQKFQNLTTSSPYERLPSLSLSHTKEFEDESGFTAFETSTKFDYTKFERNNDFVGESPNGYRINARQTIGVPFERSYGYINPKIIIDMKDYDLEDANTSSKSMLIPTLSFDGGIYLDKKISFNSAEYTQTLEPRIFYSYTPYKDQSMLPMFDTALTDLTQQSIFSENQFVGGDRIMDSHQITLGGTTRFIDQYGMERFSGTIAQRFYVSDRKVLKESQFINSSALNDSSDIFLSGSATINKYLKANLDYQYNVDENMTNRATLNTRYNPRPGKHIDASYRLIGNPASNAYDIKQINIAGQWPLGNGWSSVGRYNYDIKSSSIIEGLGGLEFDAGCWSSSILLHRLSLATTAKPNYTIFFQLELGGFGSLGTGSSGALEEVLNRNIPGSFTSNELPENYRFQNLK